MPNYIKKKRFSSTLSQKSIINRDPNNESIFIIGMNEYNYRYNINHPKIRQYYEGYKNKAGNTFSRLEFEYLLDRHLFPNGLPEEERHRREIYSIVLPAMKAARR